MQIEYNWKSKFRRILQNLLQNLSYDKNERREEYEDLYIGTLCIDMCTNKGHRIWRRY